MLPVKLDNPQNGIRLLCLGAHCDDIEIGCGGTVMRLSEEYKVSEMKWIVFTSTPVRSAEARKSATYFSQKISEKEIVIMNFRDGFLPQASEDVKNFFEELKEFEPDVIFTHCRFDQHQDHRLVSELTWNTFRNHLVLEYEIPKYDGDLGHPNFFVQLESAFVENKIQALVDYFPSQASKHWFDKETFSSLMRLRGLECAAKTRYAEAFYLRKSVI